MLCLLTPHRPLLPGPARDVGCSVRLPGSHRCGGTWQGFRRAVYLLQLEGNHGDSAEDGVSGASDRGDALRAGPFRDSDACTALGTVSHPIRDSTSPVLHHFPQGQAHRGRLMPLSLSLAPPICPRQLFPHSTWDLGGQQIGATRYRHDRQQDLAAYQHALTCSRILLTVSPFCR